MPLRSYVVLPLLLTLWNEKFVGASADVNSRVGPSAHGHTGGHSMHAYAERCAAWCCSCECGIPGHRGVCVMGGCGTLERERA